ncbi:hypothetical protein [Consotaella aegiceratis]|uniref:hypothetical protein n=1 Tax=Consotaella aegiceratis TaxID=3097961 RepID=UPI002F41678D
MSGLNIITAPAQISIASPALLTGAAAGRVADGVTSWKVSTKRGTQIGVGASVSGAGAWVEMSGVFNFKLRRLESSKTYDRMKTEYSISGGVSAFWSWLGISANASTHKEEIHEVFTELSQSQEVDGVANFKMDITGIYPNVRVDASAYVMIFQIEDGDGNTYNMVSNGDPSSDTGAQDQNGNALPQRNNDSTITI